MNPKDISVVSSSLKYSGRIFDLVEEELLFPDGKTHKYATVQHPGAVVILPEIAPGEFLVLRQYRHATRKIMLEFPAGTLKKGEDPLACAKRELEEETGFKASTWSSLGTLYPAPGFCTEIQNVYLARNLTESTKNLDEDEILEVERTSKSRLETLIAEGEFCDAKSLAAYLRAKVKGLI